MSKGIRRPKPAVRSAPPAAEAKPVHDQFLELAKKGFKDPASLNPDEIWHLCRAMIFYSPQIG